MISSRTPSPTKSPLRKALSSKDSNIIRNPQQLQKSSTSQLSPSKQSIRPVSYSRSSSISPSKSSLKNVQKSAPVLGFTIYPDPKDYSAELSLASNLKITDENEYTLNKENLAPKRVIQESASQPKRAPLADLNIHEFKGFISFQKSSQRAQLDTLWRNGNEKIRIPSYVTPPRKDRTKYISFETEKKESARSLKRANSANDIKERVIKKLVFDIHRDQVPLN